MAAVNDVLRATLVMSGIALNVNNLVFNYQVTAGSETNYVTIANAIGTWLDAALTLVLDSIINDYVSTEIELAERDPVLHQWDGKATVSYAGWAGTHAGEALPGGNAVVIRNETLAARRQARKFIPGIPEALCNGDTLNGVLVADMVLLGTDLNDDVTAGGATLRPCTYNDTAVSPLFETASQFIQTSLVNTFSGYQRRRQPGAGI